MSSQPALFYDSIYDALAADVAALGGVKKTAALLWPNKDDGAARLRACLSVEHSQKLDPEEVMAIKRHARDVGSFATVLFEAQQLGYQVEWIDPVDEADAMRREVRDLLKAVNQRLDRIERADQRAALKVAR